MAGGAAEERGEPRTNRFARRSNATKGQARRSALGNLAKKSAGASKGGGRRLNIAKAIKRPGQLHRDLNVPQGQKIPPGKMRAAAQQGGKVAQRARFAQQISRY